MGMVPEGTQQYAEDPSAIDAENPIDKDYQAQEVVEQQQNQAPSPDMIEEEGGALSAQV